MTDHVHVIDGGGYLYRAYHGSHAGDRAGAPAPPPMAGLAMLERMLGRLLRELDPRDRIVVAFDSGKSWRHQLYPAYKATRAATPADLVPQLPRARPLAAAIGLPTLAQPGLEADDLVAAVVRQARARGWTCAIHAADKDLLQLVGDGVVMVSEVHKTTFDAAAVVAKLGAPPARVADYLALVGDAGDNVPGLAGCGPKTAAALVARFPSLDAMVAACPRVRGKFPFGDLAQVDQLRLSRRLVELDGAADVGDIGGFWRAPRNQPAVVELLAPPPPPEQLVLGGTAATSSRPTSLTLTEDQRERAAILEYEAGLDRPLAERMAREIGAR